MNRRMVIMVRNGDDKNQKKKQLRREKKSHTNPLDKPSEGRRNEKKVAMKKRRGMNFLLDLFLFLFAFHIVRVIFVFFCWCFILVSVSSANLFFYLNSFIGMTFMQRARDEDGRREKKTRSHCK